MQHTVTCDIKIEPLLKKAHEDSCSRSRSLSFASFRPDSQADGGVCPPHKCPRPTVLVIAREDSEAEAKRWNGPLQLQTTSNQDIDEEEWKQRSDKRSKARSLAELFLACVRTR